MITPALSLDFTAAILDPRITFARAGATATVINSTGAIANVNADVPRFDFNPSTLACRGLLIEEARTNSLRNNTMQGVVAGTPGTAPTNWVVQGSANGLTRQIVGAGTENGIDYVDVRYSGTPTSSFAVQINFEGNSQVVAANGQTWTTSAYLKLAAGSLTNLNTIVTTVAGRDSGGNAVSGQQGTGTVAATTASLISQRFSNSFTFSSASVAFVRGGFQFSVTSGAAVNVTWRVGLPQLELGAFATSVIKTTNAAVTRNADVATITGTNFSDWWQASKGGVLVRARPGTVIGTRPWVQFDDNTADNIIALRGNATNPELYIVDGGTPQAQIDAGTIAANTDYSLTGWWATNDCKARLDSGAVVTDTSATIPTVTQARLGSDGTNYLNGHLASISYYDTFSDQIYTRRKNKVIFNLM